MHRRAELAEVVRSASETTGFFYIKIHGITEEVIEDAQKAAEMFFKQPLELKMEVTRSRSDHFNGYSAGGTGKASEAEGIDFREAFMWQCDPKYDPVKKDLVRVPVEVKPWVRGEDFVWDDTEHIMGFKTACLIYWASCLTLARKLIKSFAIALDLPENHFDSLRTYPGADGVFDFYPAMIAQRAACSSDVGIESHTDLQCFTLLL